MDTPEDLTTVSRNLANERKRYSELHTQLLSVLPPSTAVQDLAGTLITHCEEFGTRHTGDTLRAKPDEFGLSERQIDAALPLLEELHDIALTIDTLASAQNRILRADAPARSNVYYLQNRPFTVDERAREMRFLDSGEKQPIDLDGPRPERTRRRRRERQP
ncbi:MAG: hypothetical protein KDJ41_08985 [Hyphomicrobiaceae bacterium]|nr:hypothetical protein [Hyphomicrobiaceae bacterium]